MITKAKTTNIVMFLTIVLTQLLCFCYQFKFCVIRKKLSHSIHSNMNYLRIKTFVEKPKTVNSKLKQKFRSAEILVKKS